MHLPTRREESPSSIVVVLLVLSNADGSCGLTSLDDRASPAAGRSGPRPPVPGRPARRRDERAGVFVVPAAASSSLGAASLLVYPFTRSHPAGRSPVFRTGCATQLPAEGAIDSRAAATTAALERTGPVVPEHRGSGQAPQGSTSSAPGRNRLCSQLLATKKERDAR
jgi:hypothetical protein